ncbi:GSCOCG00001592001-RA-CDS [Cotesia congregata]|nr:GSCOCG00001592001-RA-CDS [Cotesia congregata]
MAPAAVLFCRNGSNASYLSSVFLGVGDVDPSVGTVPIGPNTPPLLFDPLADVGNSHLAYRQYPCPEYCIWLMLQSPSEFRLPLPRKNPYFSNSI